MTTTYAVNRGADAFFFHSKHVLSKDETYSSLLHKGYYNVFDNVDVRVFGEEDLLGARSFENALKDKGIKVTKLTDDLFGSQEANHTAALSDAAVCSM